MLLLTWKLLVIVLLNCNLIFTKPSCTKHTIEDVKEYSTEFNVETISFNDIIMEMLSLVKSAHMSHFSIVRDNCILAEHHICLNSGVSLEIADLLANNRLSTIEKAQHLILEGTEIKLYQPEDKYICQAEKLLLERGMAFDGLIEEILEKIRLKVELNSLLINIIDHIFAVTVREAGQV